MKKQHVGIFILFACGIIFSNHLNAQAVHADSAKAAKLKSQLIDTVCSCVSKSDTSKVKTADDVQGLLMQCFMSDGMSVFMDYANASGIDLSNAEQLQEWGQKIGMELTLKCPTLVKLLMIIAKDPNELKKLSGQTTSPAEKTDSSKTSNSPTKN